MDDYSELKLKSYSNNGNLVDNLISIYNFELNKEFSKIIKMLIRKNGTWEHA
ncbi:hypothetical protein [Clostridium neonatale]|uniref:Uncharacterized protein n=1 Tax=Clostridium neonatale TaxID=137838 RepID=A0AA86JF36_9CLOT|nr:hypothetical protein CNEO_40937 [Clostridium neonatale]